MFRWVVLVAGAALGGFHLWLLGHQAWSGQLASLGAIGRWTLAAALLAAFAVLRRHRQVEGSGRRAVALWVLAALLHGPALANDHDGFRTPALPEVVVTVAQAAASLAAVGAALLFLLRHTIWGLGAATGLLVVPDAALLPRAAAARRPRFLPRPPPLL